MPHDLKQQVLSLLRRQRGRVKISIITLASSLGVSVLLTWRALEMLAKEGHIVLRARLDQQPVYFGTYPAAGGDLKFLLQGSLKPDNNQSHIPGYIGFHTEPNRTLN